MEVFLFYSFSAVIIALITIIIYKFSSTELKKRFFLFPLVIVIFQIIVALIGKTGFYINFNIPPPFVYAGILPAFVLLAIFSFSKTGNKLLHSIPQHYPILFQSFRIVVELFIYWMFVLGYGPKEATMIGYNYEFYFGIIALIVGILVWKKQLKKPLIIAWNIWGLLMLVFIVGIFFTSGFAWDTFWERSEPMLTHEMLKMPAMSIATLYMPLAVWVHIFSIRQTIKSLD